MVKSTHIFSPQGFVEFVTGKTYIFGSTTQAGLIEEIGSRLGENGFFDLWDYPLDEIDHIVENELDVVLVELTGDDENGDWNTICRWFEVPPEKHREAGIKLAQMILSVLNRDEIFAIIDMWEEQGIMRDDSVDAFREIAATALAGSPRATGSPTVSTFREGKERITRVKDILNADELMALTKYWWDEYMLSDKTEARLDEYIEKIKRKE